MSGEERLLLRKVKPLFREAKNVTGTVAITAHQSNESLLQGANGAFTEIPDAFGIHVMTKADPMTLIDFGVGGQIITSPVYKPGYVHMPINAYDSRIVAANFSDADGDNQFSAKVRADGSVVYNGELYNSADIGLVPVELLRGRGKSKRIRAIAANVQSGLVVARHVELYSAALANREPEVQRLDQIRADLAGYVGETPLKEKVAALLPPTFR